VLSVLANENFPGEAVKALRARGHDVAWVRTDAPGSTDQDVLARAVSEGRILVTFDKDFGELAFRAGLPASSGVVLFRISPASPSYVAQTAVAVLESRTDWAGRFSVIEEDRVRMTPLPSQGDGALGGSA
jgi:predicted nuclease of predicted toxin-antitoxin system